MLLNKSFTATIKYIHMSPYKIRRVANQIKGCSYENALMILKLLPYRAAEPIWKSIYSAAANATYNNKIKKKNLIINRIFINEGPKKKRIRPCARQKRGIILKQTSHITIILKENFK